MTRYRPRPTIDNIDFPPQVRQQNNVRKSSETHWQLDLRHRRYWPVLGELTTLTRPLIKLVAGSLLHLPPKTPLPALGHSGFGPSCLARAPDLLLNQGPQKPCYATGIKLGAKKYLICTAPLPQGKQTRPPSRIMRLA